MLGVIPVFLGNAGPFWKSVKALPVICEVMRLVDSVIPSGQLHVVTDSLEVEDMAQRLGLHVHFVTKSSNNKSCVCPDNTLDALQAVTALVSKHSEVLVVGHRNPLLNAETLHQAVAAFRQNGSGWLVSMREVEHHPCQVKRFFSTRNLSVVYFLDSSKTEVPCCPGHLFRMTHPFPMDWSGRAAGGDGDYCYSDGRYSPLEMSVADDSVPNVIFRREGSTTRILYSEDFIQSCQIHIPACVEQGELVGIGADPSGGRLMTLVVRDARSRRHAVVPFDISSADDAEGGRVVVVPLGETGEGLAPSIEQKLDTPEGLALLDFPEAVLGCVVYHVCPVVRDSCYDSEQIWSQSGGMWEYAASLGSMINNETGEVISGRQWFPEVLEADGSFCIFSSESVASVVEEVEDDGVQAFKLGRDECVRIDSEIDYLDYIAAMKVREEREAHA